MSSNLAPLIICIFAAGLLLTLIGIGPAIRRPVERIKLNRRTRKSEDAAASVEWIYFPREPHEQAGPSGDTAEADARAGANIGGQGSTAAIEVAEAGAPSLLAAHDKQREARPHDNEPEADRIVKGARRQAEELLDKAEVEAARMVAAAGQERVRLLQELVHERSVLAETRTWLHGFMVDALREVEGTPAVKEDATDGRQLHEVRRMSAPTDADQ